MKKEATGQEGAKTGSFISMLLEEAAKRMIKGQESFEMIMDDWITRFPDMTDQDKYTLMGELTKLGFDILPAEWIFYTPPEYRTAMISSQFLKKGKTYGSRYEDVQEAIRKVKEDIKECEEWMREHPNASRMNPQTFRDKSSKHKAMTQVLEDLNEVLKITKSAAIYSRYDVLGRPMKILGVHLNDGVTVVAHDKSNNLILLTAEEVTDESTKDAIIGEDSDSPLELKRSFEMLVNSGDPLKTFFATFSVLQGEVPENTENIASFIEDFLTHIEEEKNLYDFKPEEINDAFKKLDDFVKENNLGVDVSQHVDSSITATPDEESAVVNEDDQLAPTMTPEEAVSNRDLNPEVISAASKAEVKIADTLRYMNNIRDILHRLQSSSELPKSARADEAIKDLSDSLEDVTFYVREDLIHEPQINKEAAYVVLRNIANRLGEVESAYKRIEKDADAPYIVAKSLVTLIRKSKLMLNSLG